MHIVADGKLTDIGSYNRVLTGTWMIMALVYLPMVRFYRQSPLWALLLPITASIYLWATLVSARSHNRGKGGAWKGRFQHIPCETDTTLARRTP